MTHMRGPIVAVALEFGAFPEITPLNPRFVAGHSRFKLTMDIEGLAGFPALAPPALWEALREAFPILTEHRCGDHRMGDAFAGSVSDDRQGRAAVRDEDVEIAHLLEHLVIDCQHEIAAMKTCSGITCGYESPRNRYDLFVESPGPDVSRLCVALAMALMNDLVRGRPADAVYAGVVGLARRFRGSPSDTLSRAIAARLLGDECRAVRALEFLRALGFIREIEACINFSSTPLYMLTMPARGVVGLDLRSA